MSHPTDSSKARTAATVAALRTLEQRDLGKHELPLSEIHRIWAGEFALDADGRRGLSAALEHAAAATNRRPA